VFPAKNEIMHEFENVCKLVGDLFVIVAKIHRTCACDS